jgi:hypothetical protein
MTPSRRSNLPATTIRRRLAILGRPAALDHLKFELQALRDEFLCNRMGKSSCPLTPTVSDDRIIWHPTVRQELFDTAGRVCWQAIQDVAQVLIRVVPVELSLLNQTHRSSSTLAIA